MAIGDIWRIKALCYDTTLLQIQLNNMYFVVVSDTGAGPPALNVAQAFDVVVAPLYKALMSANSKYRGVQAQFIGQPPLLPQIPVDTHANDGPGVGAGANTVPAQVSGVVSWKTALAGKHYRGRIYPGFLDTGFVDTWGEITNAGVAALQALGNAWATNRSVTYGPSIANLQLVVQGVFRDAMGIVTSVAYQRVVSALARNRLGTQRRRGQYGRNNPLPW